MMAADEEGIRMSSGGGGLRPCLSRARVVGFLVTTAFIVAGLAIASAPAWVTIALAATFAIAVGYAYLRDRRCGERWF
jgi:hypothetical protein